MVASLLASANILHFYQKKIRGKKKEAWPVSMFPETKKETRGSPALFVSGNFQGNQRVFGAPFWQLSSFPESESSSGAKSEAKPRKPGKYPGILPIWLILGPNQLISTEFPRETREETRGCCRETRKGNETGCARKHGYSLKGGESVASSTNAHDIVSNRMCGSRVSLGVRSID